MTVAQYDTQFTWLLRYAGYFIPNEKIRVQRFMNGLCDYFFDSVIIIESTTNKQVLNQTIRVKIWKKERREREGTSSR